LSTQSIQHVTASSAQSGPRGEVEHARGDSSSINVWQLRDLVRGETHANEYTIAIYVMSGQLDVYGEDGDVERVAAGDSVLIPAGVNYSMSATSADLVEFRTSK
jgi:quercetin dioxygenase-like cupin family protein